MEVLNTYVIVKLPKKKEKTDSGIFISPKVLDEEGDRGEIIAIGVGDDIKIGDIVIFNKYISQKIMYNGDECVAVKREDIFAKI